MIESCWVEVSLSRTGYRIPDHSTQRDRTVIVTAASRSTIDKHCVRQEWINNQYTICFSGLLVAYLALKELKKKDGATKFNWFMYYFHRFWRYAGIKVTNHRHVSTHVLQVLLFYWKLCYSIPRWRSVDFTFFTVSCPW